MLGKKFSSVWIPIRYSLGTALVLPVTSQGYCIMQQLVMWVILQGVGLADSVWNSYLTSPKTLALSQQMTTNQKNSILTFAENVALAAACVEGEASVYNANGSGGGFIDQILLTTGSYNYAIVQSPNDSSVYLFGDQTPMKSLNSSSNCGQAKIPKAPSTTQTVTQNNSSSNNNQVFGNLGAAFTMPDPSPIYIAHQNQAKILITTLDASAKKAIAAGTAIPMTDVNAAALVYVNAVQTASDSYASSDPFQAVIKANQDQGWALAGGWFTRLAMLSQTLNTAVNATPTAGYVTQYGSGFKFLDAVQPKLAAAQKDILAIQNVSNNNDGASDEKNDSKGKQTQDSGWWQKTITNATAWVTGLDLRNLQNDTRHPILILQDAGNRMITAWSYAAFSLGTILAIGAAVPFVGQGVLAGGMVIASFLMIPFAAMLTLGFTLAYMLPNLPFLMWIGIILGWLIMCIEAIIAAPLWAIMHLHPNGDDLTGRGGNGYMLLLGLLLRPALTIFGLIAALTVTQVMGEFVNKIFFAVFLSGDGDGLTAIVQVIFAMSVYTTAMVQLFRKTFSLMHVIPDQLLRWIGGGQEQMGQYAGGMGEAAQKGVQSASAAGSFIGEKFQDTTGKVGSQIKNDQEKSRQSNRERDKAIDGAEATNAKFDMISTGAGQNIDNHVQDAQQALNKSRPGSLQQQQLTRDLAERTASLNQNLKSVQDQKGEPGVTALTNALESGTYETSNGGTLNMSEVPGKNQFECQKNFADMVAMDIPKKDLTPPNDDLPPPPPPGGGGSSGGGGGGSSGGGFRRENGENSPVASQSALDVLATTDNLTRGNITSIEQSRTSGTSSQFTNSVSPQVTDGSGGGFSGNSINDYSND